MRVGDKVTFQQSDSFNRTSAEIIGLETYGDGSVYDPFRVVYIVRDDRRGWTHRINEVQDKIRKEI